MLPFEVEMIEKTSKEDAELILENETTKCIQTHITSGDLSKLETDHTFMTSKIVEMSQKINKVSISFNVLVEDDYRCRYYTGLESKLLCVLYDSIESRIIQHPQQSLAAKDQFILTLMKLRLNFDFKDLAFRFGVSSATASLYFHTVLDVLHGALKSFIVWPEPSLRKKNLPKCFLDAFQENTTVIIDCFEVFIYKPSNLLTHAQCWSSYKHHTTVKFLIGITPQGTVCYISNAWGGRASDKYITEHSGFLDKIIPGDIVLADHGFLIRDMLQILRTKLVIPAFTKGVSQLHPLELEETRHIAHVRIHVERVIGLIKSKYKILHGTLPISIVSTRINNESVLDKIVTVCCALINLCPPIIPLS